MELEMIWRGGRLFGIKKLLKKKKTCGQKYVNENIFMDGEMTQRL